MIKSANIATYSLRKEALKQTLATLQEQTVPFDVIRVFYNDYRPQPAKGIDQHYNELNYTDRAKFIWLDNIRITGKNEIYFTLDDDLYYPPDYVERALQALKDHPGCIVTYHGRKLNGPGLNYYYGHQQFNFMTTLKEDTVIDVPGSGVSAFNTKDFIPDIIQYPEQRMSDVLLGLEAAKHNTPIVCIAHQSDWIRSVEVLDSIYRSESRSCHRQTEIATEILGMK